MGEEKDQDKERTNQKYQALMSSLSREKGHDWQHDPLLQHQGFWFPRARLSIPFRFIRNGRNVPYQFKKRNKTEQISSHFKSRSVPDFSDKFHPERSGFIPYVPFRS